MCFEGLKGVELTEHGKKRTVYLCPTTICEFKISSLSTCAHNTSTEAVKSHWGCEESLKLNVLNLIANYLSAYIGSFRVNQSCSIKIFTHRLKFHVPNNHWDKETDTHTQARILGLHNYRKKRSRS